MAGDLLPGVDGFVCQWHWLLSRAVMGPIRSADSSPAGTTDPRRIRAKLMRPTVGGKDAASRS